MFVFFFKFLMAFVISLARLAGAALPALWHWVNQPRTTAPVVSDAELKIILDDAVDNVIHNHYRTTPPTTSTPFLTVKDAYNIYNMYCGRDYTCRVCGSVHHRNTRNDNYNPTSCYNLFRITEWDGSKDEVHVTYVKGEDTITIQYTDDVINTLSLHDFFALKPWHSDGCSNLGMGLDEEHGRWAYATWVDPREDDIDIDKLIF